MIRVEHLCFSIGEFALRGVSLDIQRGEYFVLLGKPGSGKTLLLECLAGLRRPSSGTIEIDGRRIDKAEPRHRGIGYVPQDYALFTALSVRGNVEFPLRLKRLHHLRRHKRVKEVAGMLGIEHLLERRIEGLSGGERQRVALARALAAEPKFLLLDEPVSALDDETRDGILVELRRIQRQTGTTTIHVCHDLDEMRAVAGRVGILVQGRLVQAGTPEEVDRSPAHADVARLFRLGTILSARAVPEGSGSRIELQDFTLHTEQRAQGDVQLLIRAHCLRIRRASSKETHIAARVESVLRGNSTVRVDIKAGETFFRAELPHAEARELSLKEGSEVAVVCPPEAVHLFPKADGSP